jgi:hypothetical protein
VSTARPGERRRQPVADDARLIHTLCEHSLGNPRVLLNTAGELLHAAAQKDFAQLDDKLYLDVCGQAIEATAPKRVAAGRRR